MATKPSNESIVKAKELASQSSKDLLNTIRTMADDEYRSLTPVADDLESIKEIGNAVFKYEAVYSQFMHLLGRIAFTIVRNIVFENPLRMFKKGLMEFGESIQEYYMDLPEPHQYDELATLPAWHMLEREMPNIREAYYHINYEIYYKQTEIRRDMRRAFLSESGVAELRDKIVQNMYTGANYDEYLITMYMLAKMYLENGIKTFYADDADLDVFMGLTRGLSGDMTLLSQKYNFAGVDQATALDSQVVLINPWFEGKLDAESLAYAFNGAKINFKQREVVINDFAQINYKRIVKLLSSIKGQIEEGATEVFTSDQLQKLAQIKYFIADERWFMLYDEEFTLEDFYNGEFKGWNYWLHVSKIINASPFMQCVCVTTDDSFPKLGEYEIPEGDNPPIGLLFDPEDVVFSGDTTTQSVDVNLVFKNGTYTVLTEGEISVHGSDAVTVTWSNEKLMITRTGSGEISALVTVTAEGVTGSVTVTTAG